MPDNSKGTRRKGRQKAFQILYGLGFAEYRGLAGLTRTFKNFMTVSEGEATSPEAADFAWTLVSGVWGKRDDLDAVVTRFSQHWRLERIARVELTILRLALFEMLHMPDIPLKVTINEAVELAKLFGDENSRNFVNGILDAVAKAVHNGEFGVRKEF